jgi:hypothetical protein
MTITPAETMMKAASVPMFTSSATAPRGRRLPMAAVTSPTTRVTFTGVRRVGCTFPNAAGSSPSRDIAKMIRVWPKRRTSSTEMIPRSAPPQGMPIRSRAKATGAGTFSSG